MWFSFSFASKSPDEPRIVTSPGSEVLLNSYAPTKMIPAGDTATAVGPNLPETGKRRCMIYWLPRINHTISVLEEPKQAIFAGLANVEKLLWDWL